MRRLPVPPGLLVALAAAAVVGGCDAGSVPATPPIRPGTSAAPRDVNVILKDWVFLPDPVDLAPGETVLFHVINGGLEIHELVLGPTAVQDAWETAEAAAANPPPGPTPLVTVPEAVAGLRVVVASGQRVDVTWTVPDDRATVGGLVVGCHIPGHWEKGMRAAVRAAPAPP
jgi:uncharacterized cupredoxin-like copper-binding protein